MAHTSPGTVLDAVAEQMETSVTSTAATAGDDPKEGIQTAACGVANGLEVGSADRSALHKAAEAAADVDSDSNSRCVQSLLQWLTAFWNPAGLSWA